MPSLSQVMPENYQGSLELQRLRYFVAVGEELHYGHAASRLHMTQPALTRQIQALEQELGVHLLVRSRHQVSLTEPGRLFLEQARTLLRSADEAAFLVRRASRGEIGQVTVGYTESVALRLLPGALSTFRRKNPDVHVALRQVWSADQPRVLKEGDIDIGLLRTSQERDDLKLTRVLPDPSVAAIPSSHPLARERVICLEQLATEQLIVVPPAQDYGIFTELWALCQAKGFVPRVAQEAAGALIVLGLVAAGIGIGIVPASFGIVPSTGVVIRTIAAPMIVPHLAIASRSDETSPAVLALRDVLVETGRMLTD
jgi:DNA-binding transcriptional LysR family regulator